MTRLHLPLFLLTPLLAAVGCSGDSYVIPQGMIDVPLTRSQSSAQVMDFVARHALHEGLIYQGRDDAMIALVSKMKDQSDLQRYRMARLERERSFLSAAEDLRIYVLDLSDSAFRAEYADKESSLPTLPGPALRIIVYEWRTKDGKRNWETRRQQLSAHAWLFYSRLLEGLRTEYEGVVEVSQPPVEVSVGELTPNESMKRTRLPVTSFACAKKSPATARRLSWC